MIPAPRRRNSAFTLIELITALAITVIISGILASGALYHLQNQTHRRRRPRRRTRAPTS